MMRTEVISADTIDAAVHIILIGLEADTGSSSSSRENVIYFDGWDRLGASAVLQAVAERLAISNEPATTTRLGFQRVINIDCSKWESRRALQRKIAEQLQLPNWVMEMLDKQDEEDDFNGLDKGSRNEIAEVVAETYQTVKNSRFIVILHNGSDEEIDVLNFGLSLDPYVRSKMLWTFQGRFRLDPKMTEKVTKSTTTHVLLSAASSKYGDPHKLWSYLVRHEAEHLCCSNRKHGDGIIDPSIAAQCSLYMLKRCSIDSHIIDYDWDIHTSNYWICDGIIKPAQLGVEIKEIDKSWKVGDALQQEIRLNTDMAKKSTLHPYLERSTYWFSTVTSGFVLSPSGVILSNMFQHSDRLGVLKLSGCTFSFSSPPFLCCHSLRFLWLDHCQHLLTRSTNSSDNHHTDAADKEVESWECFQSLWVLDLRYTDWDLILSAQVMDIMTQLRELNVMGAKNWDMSHIRGRLRNIRKLRIRKSTCSSDDDNLFSEMETMELLDFSGNHITPGGMASISGPAKGSRLKTVIIDGCDGLKTISLRSSTELTVIIDGCDGLKTISLRSSKELKDLLLKGLLENLTELDLSGTNVKTLNLGKAKFSAKFTFLRRLVLLGCEKLCAIFWPAPKEKKLGVTIPGVLRIDTTSASAQDAHPLGDGYLQYQKIEKFNQWQISLADARLLRSFDHAINRLNSPSLHIDIWPGGSCSVDQGTSRDKPVQGTTSSMEDSKYRDVLNDGPIAAMMMMWGCPEIHVRPSMATCIIKVITQAQGNKRLLEDAQGSASLLSPEICYVATSLHVYDDSSITSIPAPPRGPRWPNLLWCRVERCPKLHTLFTTRRNSDLDDFGELKTFWASQLLTAHYIWVDTLHDRYVIDLAFLHLDYCPRLIHVVPFGRTTLYYLLVTLEIVCCGDLREVFYFVHGRQEQDTLLVNNKVDFPRLRHIHLHELPMLHHICPCRIYAPKLETIKIRGCWSLRRLPAIGADTQPPMVDCEKEWWDMLEWDGLEAYHHPSLYQPTHSAYYKNAQLPRGTLLR